MKIGIEGRHDVQKNTKTGVVHYNINRKEMEKIRQRRKDKKNEVAELRNEVKELKDMLKTLMEKL
jgi:uncharacterized coiled-coil DUF342 family protein